MGFAFFDDQVTLEVKRKMMKNVKGKPGSKDAPKRIHPVNRPQRLRDNFHEEVFQHSPHQRRFSSEGPS